MLSPSVADKPRQLPPAGAMLLSGVMPYTFRPAAESDIQAITDIYNASVVVGGATADLTPRTLDQRRAWVESHKPLSLIHI